MVLGDDSAPPPLPLAPVITADTVGS